MSRIIFKIISPIFIVLAIVLFVGFRPDLRQHLLLDFCVVYYAMVWFSRWRFGPPNTPVSTPPPVKLEVAPKHAKALREMALHEYEYIRETMAQAMNDRHTLVNYFLLTTGLVIAAIGAVYSDEGMRYSSHKEQITIAICLILSIVAWLYLLKIVRLRQAWRESSVAMNRIKQFFLMNAGLADEHESSPFLWKSKTIPRPARKGNLYHLAVILISLIAALAVGLASVLLLPDYDWRITFWAPMLFFAHHFLLQLSAYDIFLTDEPSGRKKKSPKTGAAMNSSGGSPKNSNTQSAPARQVIAHKEETVYKNFFKIQKALLQYEKFDGTLSKKVQRFNSEHGHSAAILLHDPATVEFVLVEQFRYPAYVFNAENGWLLEIIAGLIENNEKPMEVARREVREETGYEVQDIEFLREFFPSPGSSSERIFIFFGKVGKKVAPGGGLSSEAEDIRVVRLPVREAYRLVDEGHIHDAKTLVALLSVRERLGVSQQA
ncbi:NUDIX hydrolase [candidate division KSB1 bacterium]|nr:MAG: NUDIX hydrolase [candidate division KSB1 bacterium]MBC6948322.1 NUDIX hydrolase [candidate division KSB1 bacterium]MCE7945076.1 NUDIX hydrolase [Chlorobi bacterium CHB1]MDL1875927.1 NUDIX hydrolase [Cytophagia bacterium CHB2]